MRGNANANGNGSSRASASGILAGNWDAGLLSSITTAPKISQHHRLTWRFSLPLVLCGLGLAGLSVATTSLVFERELDQQLRRRAEALATAITNAADSAERVGQLQRFVTSLGAERDVHLLMIVTGEPGRVVVANRNGWEGRFLDALPPEDSTIDDLRQVGGDQVAWYTDRYDHGLVLTTPLRLSSWHKSDADLHEARLVVKLDRKPAAAQLHHTVLEILAIELLVVAGLVALCLVLLHRKVVAPLRIVHRLIGSAVNSDARTTVAVTTLAPDEIGSLGLALDAALRDLSLLHQAVNASSNAVIITNPRASDNPIIYVNPAFEQVTGYPAAEALGRNPRFLQRDDRQQAAVQALHGAVAAGVPASAVLRNYRRDGSRYWNQMHIAPVRDASNQLIAFIGVSLDITIQRAQEDELRSTKAFLDTIVGEMPIAVFCREADHGRFRLWNRAAEQLFGLRQDQLVEGAAIQVSRDLSEFLRAAGGRVAGPGRPGLADERSLVLGDGRAHWLHTRRIPITGDAGGAGYELVLCEDITERKAAAEHLRLVHAQAEEMLGILSAILIAIDHQDRIMRFNAAAERAFNVSALDVVGRTIAECRLGLDWAAITPLMQQAISGGTATELHDLRFTRPDGSEAFVDLSILPLSATGDSTRPQLVLVGFDITDRRVAEAQRSQGQKLESIGQLSAGIAHEINTPIQFIGDNLRFLNDSFAELAGVARAAQAPDQAAALAEAVAKADVDYLVDECPKAIAQSLEGVERVAGIVRALKEFSHPDTTARKPIDLNHCIRTTLTVARNEYKYVAEVVTDLAGDLPPVPGIIGQLNQVFLNLIVNAAHAIADREKDRGGNGRGTITIATRLVDGAVEARVGDTGTGIKPEHRHRLFTPFFTTKPVGKGTGQGLALCHSIITKHHEGTIACESELGQGTTFVIRLPVRTGPERSAT